MSISFIILYRFRRVYQTMNYKLMFLQYYLSILASIFISPRTSAPLYLRVNSRRNTNYIIVNFSYCNWFAQVTERFRCRTNTANRCRMPIYWRTSAFKHRYDFSVRFASLSLSSTNSSFAICPWKTIMRTQYCYFLLCNSYIQSSFSVIDRVQRTDGVCLNGSTQ